MSRIAGVVFFCLASALASVSAGTTSGRLAVRITVLPRGEQCTTSTALSPRGILLVKVVCPSGTYVAADGVPVLYGPTAYKFRYYLNPQPSELSTKTWFARSSDPTSVARQTQELASVEAFDEVPNSAAHNRYELLISF
jgi:hypothetical protein